MMSIILYVSTIKCFFYANGKEPIDFIGCVTCLGQEGSTIVILTRMISILVIVKVVCIHIVKSEDLIITTCNLFRGILSAENLKVLLLSECFNVKSNR